MAGQRATGRGEMQSKVSHWDPRPPYPPPHNTSQSKHPAHVFPKPRLHGDIDVGKYPTLDIVFALKGKDNTV